VVTRQKIRANYQGARYLRAIFNLSLKSWMFQQRRSCLAPACPDNIQQQREWRSLLPELPKSQTKI